MARKPEGWSLKRDARTGNFTVKFRIAGRQFHRSTRCTDKASAQVEAARIYGEEVERHRRKGDRSLAELFTLWLDDLEGLSPSYVATQAKRAVMLAERFPHVSDVTHDAVRAFVRERRTEVLDTTIRRDLVPLRECLRWAFEAGEIDVPVPVFLPKAHKRDRGTRAHDTTRVDLTDLQAEALIQALPERTRRGHPARAIFTVAWDTGLRYGGVFRLEAGRHFRPGVRELYLTADIDKAGWERPMPLTERAYQALATHAPDIGPIFNPWDYRKTMAKAAKEVGLERPPDLRDFRHAATTDGARKGGQLTGVSYLAGHTDPSTTGRYIHPRTEDAQKVLDKRFGPFETPTGTPDAQRSADKGEK